MVLVGYDDDEDFDCLIFLIKVRCNWILTLVYEK